MRNGTIALALFAALVLALAPAAQAAPTLLLHYNFDEASSGTTPALDLSGLAPLATGTFGGDATRTANTPSDGVQTPSLGALNLMANDANWDYVNGGDADKLDALSAMTLTTWLNAKQSSLGDKRILCKVGALPNNGGWQFTFATGSTAGAARPQLWLLEAGDASQWRTSTAATTTVNIFKKWVFLAVTYDGTDTIKFYQGDETNGVSQLGTDKTGVGAGTTDANTANFKVGDTSSGTSRTFPGWMDDVRVYDGDLTLAELEVVRGEGLVPEPATMALLALGGLGLLLKRRR